MKAVAGAIAFGRETIRYEVIYLPTRRTLGIEVHPDQRVVVKAPTGCSEDLIAARVRKRASWISRQIADFARYKPRTPPRSYLSGETYLYLGRQYRLKVGLGDTASVRMSRGQLLVTLPGQASPERVKQLLQRWYLDHARQIYGEIIDTCLTRFKGHTRPLLIVRSMQSRWGSLSAAGSITLNLRLIGAPRVCIEYVVMHELCHLQFRDHDVKFYRLLARLMPDWEKRKCRLEAALL